MKPASRLPLIAAFVALAGPLAAQSSVWKVTRDGRTLYLGGTCHVLRATDYPLPAEYDHAFAAAEALVFETDVGRLREAATQQRLLRSGIFHDGTSLDQVIDAPAWAALQAYCARSGLPVEGLQRMRPWMAVLMVTVTELQKLGVTQQGVDSYYHERAAAAGKRVSGLESLDEHLGFLTGMGAGQESAMVRQTLEDVAEIPQRLQQLLSAWRAGDMSRLDELMLREMRQEYPAIFASLIVQRNEAWLPRIEAMLADEPVEFVLVGAGHLAGDEGLLAALRRRGCTLEQIVVKN